ncbi:rod-binding protein [Cognatishimia activa]|uniref:Chemotactic signal-response protein CheL n=1 Tax=Cognatishimia activa TaxID=1715691 RepID=A0A0P1IQJ8_9RHOB|nr:rod-binding protein [Cognatishimia activa]MEE2945379.1 rod-binding protein [Pseudomonadota bacterium]CUI96010.1 chemotactic signal-response protein CheL [Cognatishimia activa]CUK25879.1 chemotactic signal-response protein CheL [Cognatishimia activa]
MADISMLSSLSQAKAQMAQQKALSAEEMESSKEFEAVFLSQFVDEMLKTVDMGTGENDGQMWRSFMSEALSKSLVEQGGLGLASNVQQMMAAYKRS